MHQTWGQFPRPWCRLRISIIEERVLLIVRSLITTKKSHGPIRVPCGIPAGTGLKSEKQSELSLTRRYLSFK